MNNTGNGRSWEDIVTTIKAELKEFVETRVQLFKAEAQGKLQTLRIAAPLAAIAGLLIATAYLLLTLALVAVAAAIFADSPYRWVYGFLIVGVLWSGFGAIAAYFAKREFALINLVPNRTIAVLKGDKLWLQSEMRNQR